MEVIILEDSDVLCRLPTLDAEKFERSLVVGHVSLNVLIDGGEVELNTGFEDGCDDGLERILLGASVGEDDGVWPMCVMDGWLDGLLLGDIVGAFDSRLFVSISVGGNAGASLIKLLEMLEILSKLRAVSLDEDV